MIDQLNIYGMTKLEVSIERKNNIDPERFIDFYESKGWMVGKNKMIDWKAAVRNWERKSAGGYHWERV